MNKSPPSFRFCFPSSRGVRLLGLLICIATLSLSSAETYHHDGQFVANNGPSVSRDVKRAKRADDGNPLNDVVQAQAAMIQTLQAEMAAMKADMAAVKQTITKSVTFLAHFSADPIDDVGAQATLRFDSVPYNLGGAYNAQTGLFTAPYPGVYAFFVSMMSSDTAGQVDVQIVKSGTNIEGAYAQGKDDLFDQGSTLVAVHLTAGEQVWVRHGWGATTIRGGEYTIFSGFLVRPDL